MVPLDFPSVVPADKDVVLFDPVDPVCPAVPLLFEGLGTKFGGVGALTIPEEEANKFTAPQFPYPSCMGIGELSESGLLGAVSLNPYTYELDEETTDAGRQKVPYKLAHEGLETVDGIELMTALFGDIALGMTYPLAFLFETGK